MKGQGTKELPPPRGGGLQLWKHPIAGHYLLIGTESSVLKLAQANVAFVLVGFRMKHAFPFRNAVLHAELFEETCIQLADAVG